MNNDLISREDLKKSIEEYRNLNCVSTSTIIGVRNVIYLIDNAPTVNTDEIYKKGYHNGFFATHDVPPTDVILTEEKFMVITKIDENGIEVIEPIKDV